MENNLAVFVMVWGRPSKEWTTHTLRRQGYTGKIYYVADDLDKTLPEYKAKYGDDLIVFSKEALYDKYDPGDNTRDYRSTMYATNYIQEVAKELGHKYFFIFCDDYTRFAYKWVEDGEIRDEVIQDLDSVFGALVEYYKSIPATAIAMAQTGDYIGGKDNATLRHFRVKRKAMNTFLCSTDRPFRFIGRLNEDVTTYVNLGYRGELFLTIPQLCLHQKRTQSVEGGLTEVYLDYGTYVKTFYSVMYNPSCVKVSIMGTVNKRIHHRVSWNNAVPLILDEKYRKE